MRISMIALLLVGCSVANPDYLEVSTGTVTAPDEDERPDLATPLRVGIERMLPGTFPERSGTVARPIDVDMASRPDMSPRRSGSGCDRDGDCEGGAYIAHVCIGDTCSDGIKDGDETGIDCGGACPSCGG